jgi:hypothetical protein
MAQGQGAFALPRVNTGNDRIVDTTGILKMVALALGKTMVWSGPIRSFSLENFLETSLQ